MKKVTLIMLAIITGLISIKILAFTKAQLSSPVGYWLTIDDSTHQPRGVVEIFAVKTKVGTTLRGKTLAGLYIAGKPWRKYCTGCIAPWTNKVISGLTFMWNFQKSGDSWDSPWVNGRIFDIDSNTKIYSSKIWLANEGKQLSVRGYVFIFHRTQTWNRLTHAQALKYVAKQKQQIKLHPLT